MMQLISIAIGGAIGALCRYGLSITIHNWLGRGFPYGTIGVNILGSFTMGICYVMLIERLNVSTELRAGVMVGVLGAFTTFSMFSIETLNLIEAGESMKAGINILLSVTLCVSGCWLGMVLGRQV